MRVLFFVLISVAILSCEGNKEMEVGNKTSMELDNPVFDAGEVLKGEMITAKFKITNTGDFPLYIAQINASCSCTVADKPEEPISPGDSEEIIAHVNTDKTGTGILNKTLRITANTSPSITQVRIIGNVLQK